nr:MAG TPA: hypothetical protein [Caudoviricetes sp.]
MRLQKICIHIKLRHNVQHIGHIIPTSSRIF